MWKAFSVLTGVGIYIAVVIFICLYLGGLVDDYLALNGKGRIIGIILGFPIAVYSVYRQLKNGGVI
ncbi:MAG: AtpZ/AtpI family protein [Selenomonadaceae bacterium]|nr:AtpZ/AtpI family protein [Selenomonadaceae bacterium]